MKRIELYETMDGKRHPSERAAFRYAKHRYDTQLELLARELYRAMDDGTVTTPTSVCAYLNDEENIAALKELFALKQDQKDQTAEDEYEDFEPCYPIRVTNELRTRFPELEIDDALNGADALSRLQSWLEDLNR